MKTFLGIFLALVGIGMHAQTTYVVSVGIANYQQINGLRLTEQDVATFNEIMSLHDAQITTLTGSQATHANVVKTIRSVFSQATPQDAVVFFFSGHGYEGGFCCYDMRANSQLGGMSYQEKQILFRNCRAGRKMVFADACFSGGLSRQRTQLQVQAASSSNVMFFLSSQLDETSLELPQLPNGLFTYYLAQGLCGAADFDGNRIISANEIVNYVSHNVADIANRIPHNQHPTIWGNFDRTMPILKWK